VIILICKLVSAQFRLTGFASSPGRAGHRQDPQEFGVTKYEINGWLT
jgi:hypothetical protein